MNLMRVLMVFRWPQAARGMTLMELLIASTLSFFVILALGKLDLTRISISNEVRNTTLFRSEVWRAVFHITKTAASADRIQLTSPTDLKLRIPECPTVPPDPSCYDVAATYRWVEYRYNPATDRIGFYDNMAGCSPLRILARNVSGMTIAFQDADSSETALGGDLVPPDNNLLQAQVTAIDSGTGTTWLAQDSVAIRAGAYTNVTTGLTPGAGPPGSCPPP